jgi:hypothetical protein
MDPIKQDLYQKYPPSKPCSCSICKGYCIRPGWWTVDEAAWAIRDGLAHRMMLEVAPDLSFGVLSPAFRGCECSYALQEFANKGCIFYENSLCALFQTGHMPLECRYCHHTRVGLGQKCHADLEGDWNTPQGQSLVGWWMRWAGL